MTTYKISDDRIVELLVIASDHIESNICFDYHHWDGLIECDEVMTDEELEWMHDNVTVSVTCTAAGFSSHNYEYDLVDHLERQRAFSENTFGPGQRTQGVLDHIRKELVEIEKDPSDLSEWIDVVLLALDGAWRAGHSPEEIAQALEAKQTRNENRTWPDWRTADPNKAIEHVR